MARYPDARRITPNPALHAYILRLGYSLRDVSVVANVPHSSRMSVLLLSASLPDTPLNREKLTAIATVVKFPGPPFFAQAEVANEAVAP